jgi:hypothetical protein
VEERRLYARDAAPSMFVYCTEVLHLSEAEAYLRIAVARASRKHPVLLSLLEDGRLQLTGIALLAPYLTRENQDVLLKRATHKSKRQVLELIAEIAPRPDAPAAMRKLPQRGPTLSPDLEGSVPLVELRPDGVGSPAPALSPPIAVAAKVLPAIVEPLSPARYKVQFTASAELQDKLERLRALMRPQVPDGDLAAIIEQAVTEKLQRLEAKRFATTKAPRKALGDADTSPSSRYIPAAVRRAVRDCDGNRCRYVDAQGRRCPERGRLQFHHRHPFALGGDRSLRNISLVCDAHNQYRAEHDYGQAAMVRYRRSREHVPETDTVAIDSAGTALTATPRANAITATQEARVPVTLRKEC